MNWRRVFFAVGMLILMTTGTLLVPLSLALYFGESGAVRAFLESIATGLLFAALPIALCRGSAKTFYRREGLVVVTLSWVCCVAVGALPYVFSNVLPRPVDAFFESMSGFTTTGASVMRHVETTAAGLATPRAILFWRCMTNWLGGVGIVVLFVALLPAFGVPSRVLFDMESSGVGDKGFMPHVRQTAAVLWMIYAALTAAEASLLMAAGMSGFDAICHSFASIATGGFGNYDDSIGHYSSTTIRMIVAVFLFLSGTNFTLYFHAARGDWKAFLRDPEYRLYAFIALAATCAVTLDLQMSGTKSSLGEALPAAFFQVESIGTCTGFATEDFNRWPDFSRLLLVVLMFVGGSAGSTSGGIKVIRVALALKFAVRHVRRHVRPRSIEVDRFGRHVVTADLLGAVVSFVLLYVVTVTVAALLLTAMGVDMLSAFSGAATCMGGAGPGLGTVGPAGSFADIPGAGKLLLSTLMLLGRLEIYTALGLLVPSLWRE